MRAFFTFDYELYFGAKTGSVQKCMIEPTTGLLKVARKTGSRFTFFVDVLFFIRLEQYAEAYAALGKDLSAIIKQLKQMRDEGHAIQLHLHPHWLDSTYDGNEWRIDTRRYRLHQFEENEIASIVKKSVEWLSVKIGAKADVFRAGGWCIQPFDSLRKSLADCGVFIDSTVYSKGFLHTSTHFFDFRKAPVKDCWSFEADPCVEDTNGRFLEIPITAHWMGPWKFWQVAIKRLKFKERPFGDGRAVGGGRVRKLRLMAFGDMMPLSLDSERHQWLEKKICKFVSINTNHFCIISHPKALSPDALLTLERVIDFNKAKIQFISLDGSLKLALKPL